MYVLTGWGLPQPTLYGCPPRLLGISFLSRLGGKGLLGRLTSPIQVRWWIGFSGEALEWACGDVEASRLGSWTALR